MVQRHDQLGATDYYIGNNVEVGSGVVIAAGAVLDAAPGSRLIIETGVCIGSGVVIQVYGGNLTLAAGVNVGKEVLLVGKGRIGSRACIGAESTLMNPNVAVDEVVPARSLIGKDGKPLQSQTSGECLHPPTTAASSNGQSQPEVAAETPFESFNGASPASVPANEATMSPESMNKESALAASKMVYGREQVMQLVKTLFPHRDQLLQSPPEDSS